MVEGSGSEDRGGRHSHLAEHSYSCRTDSQPLQRVVEDVSLPSCVADQPPSVKHNHSNDTKAILALPVKRKLIFSSPSNVQVFKLGNTSNVSLQSNVSNCGSSKSKCKQHSDCCTPPSQLNLEHSVAENSQQRNKVSPLQSTVSLLQSTVSPITLNKIKQVYQHDNKHTTAYVWVPSREFTHISQHKHNLHVQKKEGCLERRKLSVFQPTVESIKSCNLEKLPQLDSQQSAPIFSPFSKECTQSSEQKVDLRIQQSVTENSENGSNFSVKQSIASCSEFHDVKQVQHSNEQSRASVLASEDCTHVSEHKLGMQKRKEIPWKRRSSVLPCSVNIQKPCSTKIVRQYDYKQSATFNKVLSTDHTRSSEQVDELRIQQCVTGNLEHNSSSSVINSKVSCIKSNVKQVPEDNNQQSVAINVLQSSEDCSHVYEQKFSPQTQNRKAKSWGRQKLKVLQPTVKKIKSCNIEKGPCDSQQSATFIGVPSKDCTRSSEHVDDLRIQRCVTGNTEHNSRSSVTQSTVSCIKSCNVKRKHQCSRQCSGAVNVSLPCGDCTHLIKQKHCCTEHSRAGSSHIPTTTSVSQHFEQTFPTNMGQCIVKERVPEQTCVGRPDVLLLSSGSLKANHKTKEGRWKQIPEFKNLNTILSGKQIKQQLADTSDIVMDFKHTPVSKSQLYRLQHALKWPNQPGRSFSGPLLKRFQQNLAICRNCEDNPYVPCISTDASNINLSRRKNCYAPVGQYFSYTKCLVHSLPIHCIGLQDKCLHKIVFD